MKFRCIRQQLGNLFAARGDQRRRFDDPNTLAAFVDAVRWGAVTSADANAYQAPFRSGANVEAYQLEPLRRALQSARTNLLLADDVGLGKTIEAGLVVQELLLRHRARSVVIVCPPSLSLKWQDEMQEKFGLRLRDRQQRADGQGAAQPRAEREPVPAVPPGDRLDGVAAVAAGAAAAPRGVRRRQGHQYRPQIRVRRARRGRGAPRGARVPDRRRRASAATRWTASGRIATRALAEKCEHRLFLSATPHNGYSESFTALMEMIDGRRFKRGAILDERALRDIAVRRLKADLAKEKGFRQRELKTLTFTPSDGRGARVRAARPDPRRERRGARDRGRAGGIVAMLLKKRFLSSPWSFAQTLRELHRGRRRAAALDVDDEDRYYQEVLGSGQSDEEEGEAEHPEFTALRQSKRSDPLVAATGKQIDAADHLGRAVPAPARRPATRTDRVPRRHLPTGRHVDQRAGRGVHRVRRDAWTGLPASWPSTATATASNWQSSRARRPAEDRELTSAPSSPPRRTSTRYACWSPPTPPARASTCRTIATVWSTSTSRSTRPGLSSGSAGSTATASGKSRRSTSSPPPRCPRRTRVTQRFLVDMVTRKIDKVAADLGSVNQVIDIDAEIQDHFTPSGTGRKAKLTARDDGTVIINRVLAGGTELNRALTELSRTYDQTKADMHLTPENTRRVVDTALELSGQPPLGTSGLADLDTAVFDVPSLGPAWQPALRGLETRLKPDVLRPITFDDKGRGRGDVVHIHLGHALCSAPLASSARPCSAWTRRSTASPLWSSTASRSRASPRYPAWSSSAEADATARRGVPDRNPAARPGTIGGEGRGRT